MYFSILLYHAFIAGWRIVMGCRSAPLLRPSWWPSRLQNGSSWAWGKKTHGANQENKKVVKIRSCSKHSRLLRSSIPVTSQICQNLWWLSCNCHFFIICDQSNCQQKTTHFIHYPLGFDVNPPCWRPPAPGVIFHLSLLFEPYVPLNNSCVRYGVVSMQLLKHFKNVWQNFPLQN